MKLKSLSTLVFGILAMQVVMPNFDAREVTKSETQQTIVEKSEKQQKEITYAPVNPTPEQVAAAAPTDIVVFADAKLEEAVAKELGVEVGLITVHDMLNLTLLSSNIREISNLQGLEYAIEINTLSVGDSLLTDLSPISNLTNLKNLSLENNEISDITPISNLTSLTVLNVNSNQISDITPISGLKILNRLTMYRNQISDITPLANLTNLTHLEIGKNQVSDITPLANLTNLTNLYLENNEISDITPLAKLVNIQKLYLENNEISDISALKNIVKSGSGNTYNVRNQAILLEDKIATSSEDIIFNLIGFEGENIPFVLGVPLDGVNVFSKNVYLASYAPNLTYGATVNQKVTYLNVRGNEVASTNEETELTDEELIALFEVTNNANEEIIVDASSVEYSTPGEYPVVFSIASGAELTTTLTILDVKPTIEITKELVSIEANSIRPDLIEAFGVTASEITEGDLTANITVDDSAVDYNKEGTYDVIFTVVDPEDNPVTITTSIEITQEKEIVIDETIPDIDLEVKSEETVEVASETTSQNETAEKTTTSEKSESTVAMTDENKQGLASTGFRTTILIVALSAIAAILVTLKKISVNKN